MKLSLSILALCAAALAAPVQAATIPLSSLAGANPAVAGTGLNGSFWDVGQSMGHNADAQRLSSGTPTATFLATTVDYTSSHTVSGTSIADNNSLATFLGGNASNLVVSGSHTLDTSVYLFSGWLNVTSAMDTTPGGNIDINFRVGSDDGMLLNIGGVTVTAYDTPRAYGYSTGAASFSAAGLYSISLLFYENYGNTGVDLAWQTAGSSAWQDIPTADLYASLPPVSDQVPEPASIALLGIGCLAAVRGRKKA